MHKPASLLDFLARWVYRVSIKPARFLRAELPRILATPPDVLSVRMMRVIKDLAKTGAGSMSGSISYLVRLPSWPGRTPDASG